MRVTKLTNASKKALSLARWDKCDEQIVKSGKWYLTPNGYLRGRINGERRPVFFHRIVMGSPAGKNIDHINGDKLDNRRSNLRVCTVSQNQMNAKKTRIGKTASAFKGVDWVQRNTINPWRAKIKMNGKQVHLGCFSNELLAAIAYDKKAKELFGEFARPNFPEGSAR